MMRSGPRKQYRPDLGDDRRDHRCGRVDDGEKTNLTASNDGTARAKAATATI